MIETFGNSLAEDIFADRKSRAIKGFPSDLFRSARRKLLLLHDAAELGDMRVPPGNRLEAGRGSYKGFYSIRINDQWRIIFRWENGNAHQVSILDYHK